MRKVCSLLILLTLGSAAADGAVAVFDPPHIDLLLPGDPAIFEITLTADSLEGFNWADVVIGIDEANALLSFDYSSQWENAFANVSPVTYDGGFYLHDVYAGGNNPSSVGTELTLGTLTVDTTNLSEGPYEVTIDYGLDGISSLGLDAQSEPLNGHGTFPEPTSLLLLAAGFGVACRPRRSR